MPAPNLVSEMKTRPQKPAAKVDPVRKKEEALTPLLDKEVMDIDKQIEAAWKILEMNVGFSRHFDFKPAGLLTVAAAGAALAGAYVKELAGRVKPETPIEWQLYVQFGLVVASAVVLILAIAQIIVLISPTKSARFLHFWPGSHGKSDARQDSMIYFSDIAHASRVEPGSPPSSRYWSERMSAMQKQSLLKDLADQVVENAVIAEDKAARIRLSAEYIIVGLGLGLALIIFSVGDTLFF
jgi:hypothetical protein